MNSQPRNGFKKKQLIIGNSMSPPFRTRSHVRLQQVPFFLSIKNSHFIVLICRIKKTADFIKVSSFLVYTIKSCNLSRIIF